MKGVNSILVKQVIVMRKDLKNYKGKPVNEGKLIAQGAHASLAIFTHLMKRKENNIFELEMNDDMIEWVEGIFTKVCLGVDSEEELIELFNKAKEKDLPTCLITDNGLTEFKGIYTNTCISIEFNKSWINRWNYWTFKVIQNK